MKKWLPILGILLLCLLLFYGGLALYGAHSQTRSDTDLLTRALKSEKGALAALYTYSIASERTLAVCQDTQKRQLILAETGMQRMLGLSFLPKQKTVCSYFILGESGLIDLSLESVPKDDDWPVWDYSSQDFRASRITVASVDGNMIVCKLSAALVDTLPERDAAGQIQAEVQELFTFPWVGKTLLVTLGPAN